ncbi:MAG: NAD-dependent epimerase/dehydratase family protein, partial [Candidatus Aureabacteria bacterium]|nr:NAD-dependent epimerase/dehydratase family protein [Candidatus Auribacterota bacterium]
FSDKIDFIEGDIRDRTATDLATKGVDYVLHEAALPSVQRSVEDPVTTNNINVSGTLNLLLSAKKNRVKRFVFASSSSVYGDSERLPKKEDMLPNPLSAYALSKLTGEYYCKIFYDLYGLETVCLRYFNVFGPRQDPQSDYAAVIPRFISAIISGRKPVIYGDGKQSRDFTFVNNVVEANLAACSAPRKAVGRVYNIACGDRYSLLCLLDNLGKISGVDVDPVFEKARLGDVKHSQADIEEAKKHLGLKTYVGFADGLKETFEWYKKNNF